MQQKLLIFLISLLGFPLMAQRAPLFVSTFVVADGMKLTAQGNMISIVYDVQDERGIEAALVNLRNDLHTVTGAEVRLVSSVEDIKGSVILAGSVSSSLIKKLVAINAAYTNRKMEQWQANSINETMTRHAIGQAGKTTLRVRVHEPGVVIQKIILNTGGMKKSYLGAPETIRYK